MKKMNVFYQVTLSVLLFISSAMFSGTAWSGEKATADGFVGVPWGASRSQVASIMKEKGFTIITNNLKELYDTDVYRGTFADLPADLYFRYNGRDFFNSGWAILLDFRGQGLDVAIVGYKNIMPLLKAKYGGFDSEIIDDFRRLSTWNAVETKKGTSFGVAKIRVQGGRVPDFFNNQKIHGVWIQYDFRSTKDL